VLVELVVMVTQPQQEEQEFLQVEAAVVVLQVD
jgi:hypothetical protein